MLQIQDTILQKIGLLILKISFMLLICSFQPQMLRINTCIHYQLSRTAIISSAFFCNWSKSDNSFCISYCKRLSRIPRDWCSSRKELPTFSKLFLSEKWEQILGCRSLDLKPINGQRTLLPSTESSQGSWYSFILTKSSDRSHNLQNEDWKHSVETRIM